MRVTEFFDSEPVRRSKRISRARVPEESLEESLGRFQNHQGGSTISNKSDTQLHKDVIDELAFESSIDAGKISVAVNDGVVTLSGSVSSYFEKWAAESAVKRVNHLAGIAEELTVDFMPNPDRSDTDIAETAVRALEWNTAVPKDRVQIKVSRGWLTLEGDLDWQFQRQAAHDVVAHLQGVKGVSNDINIRPSIGATDVQAKIESALKRSAELDAKGVTVEIEGNSVTLRGKLHTWAEREAAARAAWNASGVQMVSNQILVSM